MSNDFSINVTVSKELFYSQDSMFGVYALIPNDKAEDIELNNFGNFVVNGNTPQLIEGEAYDIEITPSKHPKYGDGFTFTMVHSKKPTSIKEQQEYVKMMLPEKQSKQIFKIYPNEPILDLIKNDDLDYTDMKGIKEATYQKIKEKLFTNIEVQQALVELKDLEVSATAMKQLINHFGSAEMVVKKVKNNIYALCEVGNFGFKKIDKYAMKRGDNPESKERIVSAIEYLLKEDASSGNSWMGRSKLLDKSVDLLEIERNNIIEVISDIETQENSDFHIENNKIGLAVNYYFEKTIYEILMNKLNDSVKTKGVDWENKITELENKMGIKYTDEQKSAVEKSTNNNVMVVNGRAGSGKSLSVKAILHALNGCSYCTTAMSGKAARVLGEQGLKAMTIHRMLGIDRKSGGFIHNEKNPLPYDIIVLDEASMANIYLIYSILRALKDDAKMIFVGDSGQLPSIGVGAVFEDIQKDPRIPQQELTKIHRQAAKSGILSVANNIRDGHHINSEYSHENQNFGELKDMLLMPIQDKNDIKEQILGICRGYKHKDINEFQVITGLRDRGDISVKELNNDMQEIFNDTSKPFVKRGVYEYREGDKIIQNGNNYKAGVYEDSVLSEEDEPNTEEVFNGTLGRIVKIQFDSNKSKQDHKLLIKFEDIEELIVYSGEELNMIELAYAITTHKSQGSSIKHVIFAFDFASFMLLSREFVYTGLTRASEGCVLIAENKALHYAIEQTAGDNRNTFLRDMLQG